MNRFVCVIKDHGGEEHGLQVIGPYCDEPAAMKAAKQHADDILEYAEEGGVDARIEDIDEDGTSLTVTDDYDFLVEINVVKIESELNL